MYRYAIHNNIIVHERLFKLKKNNLNILVLMNRKITTADNILMPIILN